MMNFNKEDWLYQYTRYLNSRYYQYKKDDISNLAFESKKKKIKIVKSLEDITCPKYKIYELNKLRKIFDEKLVNKKV